jgi:uncharacterized protein (DUF433 family)
MQLESYFDHLADDDIRIKGHRIGIETVLYDYIYRSRAPEAIQASYPTLTLAEVYATILYYHIYRDRVDAYLATWLDHARQRTKEQDDHPDGTVLRLRSAREQRHGFERQTEAEPA